MPPRVRRAQGAVSFRNLAEGSGRSRLGTTDKAARLRQCRGSLIDNSLDDLRRSRNILDEVYTLAGPDDPCGEIIRSCRQIRLLLLFSLPVRSTAPRTRSAKHAGIKIAGHSAARTTSNTRVCSVWSPPAATAAAFIARSHKDSRVAVKRVPIDTPVARQGPVRRQAHVHPRCRRRRQQE
jgi:hypothetical protein